MHHLLRNSALALLAISAGFSVAITHAAPNVAKYPLRVNILSSNSSAYYIKPSLGGPMADVGAMAAAEGDTGGPAPNLAGGLSLNYDPVQMFYGNGKANLVSPTAPTIQGFTFLYDECLGRLGTTLPDKPFIARWKKKTVLELLVPLESTKIPKPGAKPAATKYDKCDVTVIPQRNIFLLLQNGSIVSVSQDDFAKKPALRQFTVGPDPKLMPRKPSATPAAAPAGRRPVRPRASTGTAPATIPAANAPATTAPTTSAPTPTK